MWAEPDQVLSLIQGMDTGHKRNRLGRTSAWVDWQGCEACEAQATDRGFNLVDHGSQYHQKHVSTCNILLILQAKLNMTVDDGGDETESTCQFFPVQ